MTRLQALEEEIKKLTPVGLAELRTAFRDCDWEEWDRQIERDGAAGKLDKLFGDAEEAHRKGKSTVS